MTRSPEILLLQYPGRSAQATLSGPCGKVHMALRFKGLEYSVRNLLGPDQARRFNPRGRLPVLRVDGEIVVDSTDILTYVERRFPEPPLEPAEAGARAAVKVLEDWADEVLYFLILYVRWQVPDGWARMGREVLSKLPAPRRWIVPHLARRILLRRLQGQGTGLKDEATVHREIDECLGAIDVMLHAGPFLVGDRPTRADLAVAAMLDQLRLPWLTPEGAARIESRPAITDWLERIHARAPDAAG